MSHSLDKLLPLLLEVEKLTAEDREALFIALSEQYQWTPECSTGVNRGVSASDFGPLTEDVLACGARAELCESSRAPKQLEELRQEEP